MNSHTKINFFKGLFINQKQKEKTTSKGFNFFHLLKGVLK